MFSKKRKNRGRNLADQDSKRVYSYYSNTRLRSEEQSDRARQNTVKDRQPRAQRWWHHIPSILALVAILICLGYILSVNTNPNIVQISGSQSIFLHDKNTYQAAANKIINKSILNYNKVTINVTDVTNQLKQQFPELSNVTITLPLVNRRPVIYISASQPAIVLMTETNSAVVDTRGIAVLPTSQVKDLTKYNLPTVKDDSGLSLTTGQLVLPGSSVKFILNAYQQLKEQSLQVGQLTLPAVANELDIKLSDQKYYTWVTREDFPQMQQELESTRIWLAEDIHDYRDNHRPRPHSRRDSQIPL